MDQLFKYTSLATKIRAMKGKMLKEGDFRELMIKPNVKEAALYLKKHTYYSEALKDLDESDIHRGYLEILLYRAVITDALKIAKYLKGKEKLIYRFIYRRQEVEDIKRMLRTLRMGHPLSEIDRKTLFISRKSRIDFNKSLMATNEVELVD